MLDQIPSPFDQITFLYI